MGGIITQTFWKRKNKKGLFLTYFFYENRSEIHVTVIKIGGDHCTVYLPLLSVRACFPFLIAYGIAVLLNPAVRKNKQTLEDQTGNLKCIVGAARVCGGWWIARYGRICTDQSSQKTGSELRFRCRAGNAGMESVLSACRGTLWNTERLCRTLCFLLCANALAKMPDRCGTKVDELFDRLCERFSGRLYDLYCHYGLYDPDPCRLSEYPKKAVEHPIGNLIYRIGRNMKKAGGTYLKAQLIILLIISSICCVGLFLTGNSYAVLVGCGIGLCDALPFFGTGTVFIPWLLFKVFCGQYLLAGAYGIIYLICNFTREFLEPKLIGSKLSIHPMLVLISTYVGLCVFGVFGFFLGPVAGLLIAEIYKASEEG